MESLRKIDKTTWLWPSKSKPKNLLGPFISIRTRGRAEIRNFLPFLKFEPVQKMQIWFNLHEKKFWLPLGIQFSLKQKIIIIRHIVHATQYTSGGGLRFKKLAIFEVSRTLHGKIEIQNFEFLQNFYNHKKCFKNRSKHYLDMWGRAFESLDIILRDTDHKK